MTGRAIRGGGGAFNVRSRYVSVTAGECPGRHGYPRGNGSCTWTLDVHALSSGNLACGFILLWAAVALLCLGEAPPLAGQPLAERGVGPAEDSQEAVFLTA